METPNLSLNPFEKLTCACWESIFLAMLLNGVTAAGVQTFGLPVRTQTAQP
jgi:hypothetical protein